MATAEGSDLKIVQLDPSFDSLGRVLELLSKVEPFSQHKLADATRAVGEQISRGAHVAAVDRDAGLVGYAGWVRTSRSYAELWVEGKGPLRVVEQGSDAAALTIVVAGNHQATVGLIRAARGLNPGIRVYFMRGYETGTRQARKVSVLNRVEAPEVET